MTALIAAAVIVAGGPAVTSRAAIPVASGPTHLPVRTGGSPSITAYVPNYADDTVTPINTATDTVGTAIAVGPGPDAVAITPDGATAYVANSLAGTVTPISTATNTGGVPITVGNVPTAIAITPNGATAYVTNQQDNTVTPISTATNSAGTPIAAGTYPTDIVITPNGATAYVADLNGETVTPISTATNTAGTPIAVGNGPIAMAITPNGATLYVVNANGNSVTPISTATNTAGTPIPVGHYPLAIAITPDGAVAYVANYGGNTVTPISTATNTAGTAIPVGSFPDGVATSPDDNTAYVANFNSNTVTPITTSTNAAGTPIPVGSQPEQLAITPDQAPVAALNVTPATAGQATSFDASASTSLYYPIARYRWNFGDGHTAVTTGPTVKHTYAAGGDYTATLTVVDAAGTSTAQVFTGQTMSRNGSSAATTQTVVAIPAHFVWTTTSASMNGDIADINNPATNGRPGAMLYITPNFSAGGVCGCVIDNVPDGVVYDTANAKWGIYNQDLSNVPIGAEFNVVVIPTVAYTAFRVIATSSDTVGNVVYINTNLLNNQPGAALQATQMFNDVINDHAFGVIYNTSTGEWGVYNQGGAPMPAGAAYNILVGAGAGGKTAVLKSTTANTGGNSVHFNNSVTNNNPNNFVLDTPIWDPAGACGCVTDTSQTGVWYNSGQEVVFNESNANMIVGTDFNLIYWKS